VVDMSAMLMSQLASGRAAEPPRLVADPALAAAVALLQAAGYMVIPPPDPETVEPHAPLSVRERQVANLLLDGASNKVIARDLDISVHTAKFHVTAILDKLSARNRADAVAIILREGLVTL
jgi:DNA-binding NarL/FixJ family response regulator